ncbi:restriction endonuclease subunit S, partial [Streptococcus thermophilus]|nr:restriction endonuclease subunit S [Streptococcus thermophilus]
MKDNQVKYPQLRFKGFTDPWEQRKSSAIFHTITDFVANGSFASLRENVSYSDKLDYAIVVRLTDYSNGYKGPFLYTSKSGYDFLKKSSLNPNDILISNVGANAGLVFKAPILDVPMTLGPNSILVRTSDQDREFMYQLMRSTTGEHLIKTQIGISAQPKFNKTEFKQIIFTIPKSQEEQQKIGNLFHELDHTIA